MSSLFNVIYLASAGATPSTAPPASSGGIGGWGLLIAYGVFIFGALYLFFIRPNKKKKTKEAEMLKNLQIGDEIVTNGGIYGRIVSVKDDSVIIESSTDKSKIRVAKWAVIENKTLHE